MSTREKIIVFLMVVAIGWGIFSFRSWRNNGNTEDIDPSAKALDWATALQVQIEKETRSISEDHYIQERVEGTWKGDPFFDSSLVASLEKEGVQKQAPEMNAEKLGLKYTGYLSAGQKLLAVINGIEYEIGEKLETPGNFVIQNITPNQVIIFREETGQRIAIPLEETTY